jgi:ribosomal protein S18 acetylase RimI-like enzyme
MTKHVASAPPAIETLRIRSVTPADLPAIVKLDEAATGTAKPVYWRDLLDGLGKGGHRDMAFLVAEIDGRLIGFITGNVRAFEFGTEPCGWVFALCVDPGVRDKNVGTRLFDELCACFRRAGVTKVRTILARDNELVLAFFRSLGMMAGPFIQLEKDLD